MKRKIVGLITAALILLGSFGFVGCDSMDEFVNPGDNLGGGGIVTDAPETPDTSETESQITELDTSESNQDTLIDYVETDVQVTFSDQGITSSGEGATVSGKVVTISQTGTYILSGTMADGQVVVNVDGNVHLVLDNLDLSCSDSAPIAIFGKKKKVITLADGSQNSLSDAATYSVFYNTDNDEPNGCLYSDKALTINGNGKLSVVGKYNNGISCKDELRILGGEIVVEAVDNGIKGNDCLIAKNCSLQVDASGDGLKSDSEDEDLGYIYLENVILNLTAAEDGIQAYRALNVVSGSYTIKTGGGAQANTNSTQAGSRPNWWEQTTTTDDTSKKGIKSDLDMLISGGTFSMDCEDDALHSNGTILIQGGEFNIQSGDDALHADEVLSISEGSLGISKCYEGLEAAQITISGGEISIVSSDDGINASDGSTTASTGGFPGAGGSAASSNCSIIISGGNVDINASGDGIDSNGTLLISGGFVLVDGPTSGADGSLDTEAGILVNGGTLIALGSLGMVETPSQSSQQNCVSLAYRSAQSAGKLVEVRDSAGQTLVSFTPAKSYQSLIISLPDFTKGSSYSVYINGSQASSFTVSSVITSVGSTGRW